MSTGAYDSACRDREASFNETLSKYHMEAAHDMADIVANKLPPYIWDKQDLQPGLDGVMVVGLQSNSELNGSMGVIEGGAPNSRITVRVFPLADAGAETLLSLAPKNVRTAVAIQQAHKLLASETHTYIVRTVSVHSVAKISRTTTLHATSCSIVWPVFNNITVPLQATFALGSCAMGLPAQASWQCHRTACLPSATTRATNSQPTSWTRIQAHWRHAA